MSTRTRDNEWCEGDPLPPVNTILECGNPADRVRIIRGEHTWLWAHNNDPYRPCTIAMLNFWAPMHITRTINPAEIKLVAIAAIVNGR